MVVVVIVLLLVIVVVAILKTDSRKENARVNLWGYPCPIAEEGGIGIVAAREPWWWVG